MIRWACAAVASVVVSGFAYLLVTGRYAKDGPVLVEISTQHGLHAGDLFVLAGWLVAVAAIAVLTRTRRD